MWHGARGPRSDSGTFFGPHLYLEERRCENPLSARGPAQCKSGPGITCLVTVTIYCSIFHNDSPLLAGFYAQNTLKK